MHSILQCSAEMPVNQCCVTTLVFICDKVCYNHEGVGVFAPNVYKQSMTRVSFVDTELWMEKGCKITNLLLGAKPAD